jgi:ribosomal protein L29
MKTEIIRKQEVGELAKNISVKKAALRDMAFDVKIGKEKNYMQINKSRKEIAKMVTVLNQKISEQAGQQKIEKAITK